MARLEPDSDFLKGSCEPPANRSLRKLVKNVIPGLHQDPQKNSSGAPPRALHF